MSTGHHKAKWAIPDAAKWGIPDVHHTSPTKRPTRTQSSAESNSVPRASPEKRAPRPTIDVSVGSDKATNAGRAQQRLIDAWRHCVYCHQLFKVDAAGHAALRSKHRLALELLPFKDEYANCSIPPGECAKCAEFWCWADCEFHFPGKFTWNKVGRSAWDKVARAPTAVSSVSDTKPVDEPDMQAWSSEAAMRTLPVPRIRRQSDELSIADTLKGGSSNTSPEEGAEPVKPAKPTRKMIIENALAQIALANAALGHASDQLRPQAANGNDSGSSDGSTPGSTLMYFD